MGRYSTLNPYVSPGANFNQSYAYLGNTDYDRVLKAFNPTFNSDNSIQFDWSTVNKYDKGNDGASRRDFALFLKGQGLDRILPKEIQLQLRWAYNISKNPYASEGDKATANHYMTNASQFLGNLARQNARYDLNGKEVYQDDENYNSAYTKQQFNALRARYLTDDNRKAYVLSKLDNGYADYVNSYNSDAPKLGDNSVYAKSVYKLNPGSELDERAKLDVIKFARDYYNFDGSGNSYWKKLANNGQATAVQTFNDKYKEDRQKLFDAAMTHLQQQDPDAYKYISYYQKHDPMKEKEEWLLNELKNNTGIYSDFGNNDADVMQFALSLVPTASQPAALKGWDINKAFSIKFKNGGIMRKYQQGGQAPTAAALVMQALQAAQNGDQSGLQKLFGDLETAKAVIQLLQQEAQQGSQEAVQALEALKQIMGQGQGQAPAMARKGAKLAYIHKLSTGCPEGTELKYFKKGGHICKACVEKAKKAKCGTKAEEGAELEKCGGKAKRKKYFQPGGAVSKKRTTPAPGTKLEADSAATADRLNKGKEVYSEKTGEWIRTSPNGRTIQKTDEDGAGTTTIYIDNKGRKKLYVKPYANGGILLSQLQLTYRNLNKLI